MPNEKKCRITGITNSSLLIASHIKPWAKCNDEERLDGNNGLLLTPNADKLFDKGLISFTDDGRLLKSSAITIDDLTLLGIFPDINVGSFNRVQCLYLEYHRTHVFISHAA